jgi:hypothetical protein
MRRVAITVALGVSLALALAGCTGKPAAQPSPASVPASVLTSAVAKTTGINVKVEITTSTGDHFFGDYDSATHVAALTQAPGGAGVTIAVTPTDYYLSGPKTPKGETWHLTIGRLRDESSQALLTDVLVPLTLLTEATDVRSTRPGAFTGRIDATRLKGTTAGTRKFLDHVVKAGGAGAQALVFVATVDEHGYLSSFKTTLPDVVGGADVVYGLKLADFGAAVNAAIPSGNKVIDAPDKAYAIL